MAVVPQLPLYPFVQEDPAVPRVVMLADAPDLVPPINLPQHAALSPQPVQPNSNCKVFKPLARHIWGTPDLVVKDMADPETVMRCADEAAIHARVNGHPNIIELVVGASFVAQDKMRIVTKRAHTDLFYVLDELGKRGLTLCAYEALLNVAAALRYCHTLGVAHLDVKPENLFLGQNADGTVCLKLGDFGSARLMSRRDPHGWPRCVRPNVATLDFAPPEISIPWALFTAEEYEYYVRTFGIPDGSGNVYDGIHGYAADMWSFAIVALVIASRSFEFFKMHQTLPYWKRWRFFSDSYAHTEWWAANNMDIVFAEVAQVLPQDTCRLLRECLQFDPRRRPSVQCFFQY